MVLSTFMVLAVFLAGLIPGLLLGVLTQRGRARAEKEALEKNLAGLSSQLGAQTTDLRQLREQLSEQKSANARLDERLTAEKAALEQTSATLEEKFRSLATRALAENNTAFLDYAKQELEKQQIAATAKLNEKETAISTLLDPVKKTLDTLAIQTRELESKREGAYSEVKTLIETIQTGQTDLRNETSHLVQALRAPGTRGNWGEEQLQSCVQFAGMVEHCTFDRQYHLPSEDESERAARPDLIVRLPNDRCIVVDAKTPLTPFLEAMEAQDHESRRDRLKLHATQVRRHIDDLRKRKYWERVEYSADFVVCFLPSEALFSAALEGDPGLIEFGSSANIVLATPTTLIALLKAVAYGWQQMQITRDAVLIRDTAEQLYKKLTSAQDHFIAMGKAISNAAKQYNNLVGAVEGRGSVFSQGRKLHELGIGAGHIEPTNPLDLAVRPLIADDWGTGSSHE